MRNAYLFQPAYGGEHGDVNHARKATDFNASGDGYTIFHLIRIGVGPRWTLGN